ncbi:MAG: peptidoglycan DD-metalloendopeptidase family protein [Candidatus Pacebacteria bacterium]|nr:peptidoglycan DD-metalloendopeptidase family protein [Candidatus Paceibacterota bacterium]
MNFKKIIIPIFILTLALPGSFNLALAVETPESLKLAIEAKQKELDELNQKIAQTQASIEEVSDKKQSLQKEISKINSTISQLGLNIKASEINISKLNLEITSTQEQIDQTKSQIDIKREAVSKLLRELQRTDEETTLAIFLKNKSLAESLSEVNAIIDVNSGLSIEVEQLQNLNNQLNSQLSSKANKKSNLELENKNLKNKKVITESQKSERQVILTQTKNQQTTYEQMLTELEKEQDSISNQITDFEDKLRASFDPTLLPGKRPGVLGWPVTLMADGGSGRISSHYGQVRPKLDKGRPHRGVDIAAPIGTPVFAAADGIVKAVDNNDVSSWKKYQYGKYVFIEHQNNLATIYAHLSVQSVRKGDVVKRGDLIGYVGSTGYSTGPHLHFGLYWAPSVVFKSIPPARGLVPIGVYVNPEDYL